LLRAGAAAAATAVRHVVGLVDRQSLAKDPYRRGVESTWNDRYGSAGKRTLKSAACHVQPALLRDVEAVKVAGPHPQPLDVRRGQVAARRSRVQQNYWACQQTFEVNCQRSMHRSRSLGRTPSHLMSGVVRLLRRAQQQQEGDTWLCVLACKQTVTCQR
jgi:hypothetical protein